MRAFTIVSLALLGACDVLSRHNGGAARRARPATAKTGVIAGVDAPVLEVRASQAETGKAVDAGDREQKLYIELFNDRNFQGRSVSYGPHKRCGRPLRSPLTACPTGRGGNRRADTPQIRSTSSVGTPTAARRGRRPRLLWTAGVASCTPASAARVRRPCWAERSRTWAPTVLGTSFGACIACRGKIVMSTTRRASTRASNSERCLEVDNGGGSE